MVEITPELRARMDAIEPIPRLDAIEANCRDALRRNGKDEQLAPVWAEKLRHTMSQVFEIRRPEYAAANGDVIPIDASMPPGALTWEYFLVDQQGFADWIDDDGTIMPNGAMTAKRFTGEAHEMGHKYDVNMFDLERAAEAGLQLSSMKAENAKRTHDAKTHWTWLFGEPSKNLPGLVTHPNITVSLAPAAAAAPFGDNRDRLIENKTIDEILSDLELLIETIPRQTIRAHFVAKVLMPYTDVSHMKRRRLGPGDGSMSLWDYVMSNYGTAQGEHPAVQFQTLNECDGDFRREPVSQADQSGLSGRFWMALPVATLDELAFVRARPFTQRPPQEQDLKMHTITHSKIGGCRIQIPLAVHRLDFLAQNNSTAAP